MLLKLRHSDDQLPQLLLGGLAELIRDLSCLVPLVNHLLRDSWTAIALDWSCNFNFLACSLTKSFNHSLKSSKTVIVGFSVQFFVDLIKQEIY